MRKNSYCKAAALLMTIFVATLQLNAQTAAPADASKPPEQVVIPEKQVKDNADLSNEQKGQVQARINYWLDQIATAPSDSAVIDARTKLIEDYNLFTAQVEGQQITYPKHQEIFPLAIAGPISKLLDMPINEKDMQMQRVREINAAIIIEYVSQAALQPTIEKMVAHRNAAVRYFGWKSYLKARQQILTQVRQLTDAPIAKLMASLKLAMNEKDGPIIGVVFQVLDFPASGEEAGLSKDLLKEARKAAFADIKEIWKKHYLDIMGGDADMSVAYVNGLTTLQNLVPLIKDEEKDGMQVALQMMVDIMMAGAKGYQRQWEQATPDSGPGLNDPVLHNNILLALTAEETIGAAITDKKSYVREVITRSDRKAGVIYNRGAGMVDAALAWVDTLSKEYRVTDPKLIPPPPTTKPTSKPTTASAPATKPAAPAQPK